MEKQLTLIIDKIINEIGQVQVLGADDKVITDVTADSRVVQEGSLFICLKGATVDGHKFLKMAVEKGAVARHEPGFVCTPLVSMEQVQEYETRELINKMYQGSADLLVASLIGQQKLSGDEIMRLKALVSQLEG